MSWRRPLGRARALVLDEPGQTMAEYGFILAAVALVVMASAILFGQAVIGLYDEALAVF